MSTFGSGTARHTLWIDTVTLVTLVDNVYRAAAEPSIGYADADRPMNMLIARLSGTHPVDIADLESALWSCNMMNEEEKFWHPKGFKFDHFIAELKLKNKSFNRIYNVIEYKGEK